MRKLSSAETKHLLLNAACEIKENLNELDIPYSIFYGSLLGALRHSGFIPWDDDFDVVIPAKFVKKLSSHACTSKNLRFFSNINTMQYYDWVSRYSIENTRITINKKSTQVNEDAFESTNSGLSIDIYPVYPLPSNKLISNTIIAIHKLNARLRGYAKKKSNLKLKYLSRILDSALSLVPGSHCFIPADYNLIYKKPIFINQKSIAFEKEFFLGPSNPEYFLKKRYGNWETPPDKLEISSWVHYESIHITGDIYNLSSN